VGRNEETAASDTGQELRRDRGFGISENNGPGGKGHLNVINCRGSIERVVTGRRSRVLYKCEGPPSEWGGPIVSASIIRREAYDDWANRDEGSPTSYDAGGDQPRNIGITYEGFIRAGIKGGRCHLAAGMDNSWFWGDSKQKPARLCPRDRETKAAVLEAMQARGRMRRWRGYEVGNGQRADDGIDDWRATEEFGVDISSAIGYIKPGTELRRSIS